MTRVRFNERARLLISQAAAKFTHRYEGLSNRWVYGGGDYGDNNYMAVLGEVAAGIVLGAEHFPSSAHWPYDFVAGGWRVDAKTTEGSTLQIRQGHAYKLTNCDVLALVSFDSIEQCTLLGWIWSHEFGVKAKKQPAKHTEDVLSMRRLLSPLHWKWLMLMRHSGTSARTHAEGPPWPGGPGPHQVPADTTMTEQWNEILEHVELVS